MDSEKQSYQIFDNLLFPKIFQTFRMAIQPTKLIIALLALAIICLAGWIMDFSRTVVTTPAPQGQITELHVYMASPGKVKSHIDDYKEIGSRKGVFSTLWQFAAARFNDTLNSLFAFNLPAVAKNIADYFKAVRWALRYHFLYCIIFFVIKLAVISVAGGAICRIAALQFARDERPGLTEALRFSLKKFISLFTAPLAPVGIIIFIGLFISLLGLIGSVLPRIGELIIGIFMPLALIAGTLIAVFLIGTVAGFNLMFPAIAYDGSDCLDAISRSFSYVYSKPWRMGFYTAIAIAYGAICYTFVRFFALVLFWSTRWFLQLGILGGNKKLVALWPEQPSFVRLYASPDWQQLIWSEWVAALLVYLCILVVIGLLVSFIITFYFSANTIIYSLMRNSVDNTALEDIFSDFEEVKSEPVSTEIKSEESQPKPEAETQTEPPD
ncbi:MAG: hypothetical protein AMJ43_08865 [Coxiella sp. DG_40]|nr:MAG: hypothetical protein AMJ43_08865 [Coxiella sp. DG_40]